MKTLVTLVGGMIIGAAAASYACYLLFWDLHSIEEVKLTHLNLTRQEPLSPQLREYLKERFYSNLAYSMRYRDNYFTGSMAQIDFGPVNPAILNGVTGIKGPESPDDIYKLAMERFKKRPK